MRTPTSLKLAVVFGLVLGGSALAARKPTDFQEPAKMTEEELAAAKQRSKYNINSYGEMMEEKPKPFPWMAVSLAGICFLVATPFALRAYRNTSREIAGSKAFGASQATDD
jgi:hypothetical protein